MNTGTITRSTFYSYLPHKLMAIPLTTGSYKFSLALLFSFLFLITENLKAQYQPYELFTPDFYQYKGNNFRSASGKPGPEYWQNEANYTIEASFDVETHVLEGKVDIEYVNNSPDRLDYLWLQMDQNESREDARRIQMRHPQEPTNEKKEGFQIENLELTHGENTETVDYKVYGTRMQVFLNRDIEPGETVNLSITYHYKLPQKGNRSGYMENEAGSIYNFTYWYPRMSVYDDYYGWNTLPFIGGGEMYLDYGTIDYKLTVPSDQLIAGAGYLVNQEEILTDKLLKRLKKASQSDKTVLIRKENELNEPVTRGNSDTVTWHFRMENTRDVAWTMSADYMWDAAKINLSDGKTALAQSVYPPASIKEGRSWARSTQMLKHSVEYFSTYIMDFPYPVATDAAGSVSGMEYPAFATNGWDTDDDYFMYLLAQHEIGHTWFPMIVGSDERRNAFLDEGFNVFVDVYAQEDFNHGEFAPKRDGEYAPGGGNPADEIIKVIEAAQKNGATLMMPADNVEYKYVHPLSYFKASFGLVLLREVILGPERFDFALRNYAKNWAYKHPRPEDFFRSMDNATGEDLTWFWNGWFHHNWQLDQAVEKVDYVEDNPKKGALITLKNNQKMAMPVLVHLIEENGKEQDLKLPVDIWKFGGEYQFRAPTTSTLQKIILDMNHQLPDTDRSNNVWEG